MAELQTPRQNGSFFTPQAPKRDSVPRMDQYKFGSASLSSPVPSIHEAQDHGDLKSLVDSSEPDCRPTLTYLGPPIGYAAKLIKHRTPCGVTTTSVYGSLMAPRPCLIMQCEDRLCSMCHPVPFIDDPATGSTTPTPRLSQQRKYVSPRSSPRLNMQKILRDLELGLD